MRRLDVISKDIPEELRTKRGEYTATITVVDRYVDYYGVYELPETAPVRDTIESRLRSVVDVSISLDEE